MSILDGLKKAIFVDGDDKTKKQPTTNQVSVFTNTIPETVFNGNNTVITSVSINNGQPATGEIPLNYTDPNELAAISAHFDKLMADSDLPGPDYYEYKMALKNMASMPLDEATKYKMAYSTLKAMKLQFPTLVSSISQYVTIINSHKSEFNEELNKKYNSFIESRNSTIQMLTAQNEAHLKEIEELNKKIAANNIEIDKNRTEVNNNAASYQSKKKTFELVHNNLLTDLNNDLNKIQTYITPDIA